MTMVRKSKSKITGAGRKGVQASDLIRQLTNAVSADPSPTVDKPRVLIETLRIVGEDNLTAQDAALYELMLANARKEGIDLDRHFLPMPDVLAFLRIKHADRVLDSLERLTRTIVRYDIATTETRRRAPISMISAEIVDDLRSGTSVLAYEIPRSVREIFLAARQYAMLEIAAFAEFSSRYAGRLYQRLALRAGMDGDHGKVWEIEPRQLADQLGYPTSDDGSLHMASFMRRCVEPAVSDIQQHVSRFSFDIQVIRGAGRGRPVEKLVFRISAVQKHVSQMRAANLSTIETNVVRSSDDDLDHADLPGTVVVGRAVTATGIDAATLSHAWRAFLKQAKADPYGSVDGIVENRNVISKLRSTGVGEAFWDWVEQVYLTTPEATDTPSPRIPVPAVIRAPAPVAVGPASTPVVEEQAVEPPIIRKSKEELLADAKTFARNAATDILDYCDGFYPGRKHKCGPSSAMQILQSYVAYEVPPWSSVGMYIDEKTFRDVVLPAIRTIRAMADDQFKKTMVNIAISVRDWDIPQFLRICKAIGFKKPSEKVTAAPRRTPPPFTSRIATRPVTEASAEYDFADPAYRSVEEGFDYAFEGDYLAGEIV